MMLEEGIASAKPCRNKHSYSDFAFIIGYVRRTNHSPHPNPNRSYRESSGVG